MTALIFIAVVPIAEVTLFAVLEEWSERRKVRAVERSSVLPESLSEFIAPSLSDIWEHGAEIAMRADWEREQYQSSGPTDFAAPSWQSPSTSPIYRKDAS